MAEWMIAPALTWRAFLLASLLAADAALAAPPTVANPSSGAYVQAGELDQAEGRRAIELFRNAGIPGEYYLEFDIRVMPRRGEDKIYHGRLWGGRNDQGAVMRLAVQDATGHERRLLIQNGERAGVWRSDSRTETPQPVSDFEPLVPGVELTAFELQMPYLYWSDVKLLSVAPVRGRPAHVFWFRPPAEWAKQHPDIGAVRACLDTQYHAPVQSELIGPSGRVLRTLSLVDLKKIDDQFIVKSIDLRNDETRDKTRFQVTAAALGLDFTGPVFDPARLNEDVARPEPARTTRL